MPLLLVILSAIGAILGGSGTAFGAYVAFKNREQQQAVNVIESYSGLIASLQGEVGRLQRENNHLREEVTRLNSRLVALEKDGDQRRRDWGRR